MKKLFLVLLAINFTLVFAKPVSGPMKYLNLQGAGREAKSSVDFAYNGHVVKIIIPRAYPNQVKFGMPGDMVIKRYSNLDAELTFSDKIVYGEITDEIQGMVLEPRLFNFFSFSLTTYQIQICNSAPFRATQKLCLVGEGLSLERYLAELENHSDAGINLKISTTRGKNLTLGFASVSEFRDFFNIPLKKSRTIRNAIAACGAALAGNLSPSAVPTLTIQP